MEKVRWEYLRRNNAWGDASNGTFDTLGAEGWELIGFTDDGTFMFKRPVDVWDECPSTWAAPSQP